MAAPTLPGTVQHFLDDDGTSVRINPYLHGLQLQCLGQQAVNHFIGRYALFGSTSAHGINDGLGQLHRKGHQTSGLIQTTLFAPIGDGGITRKALWRTRFFYIAQQFDSAEFFHIGAFHRISLYEWAGSLTVSEQHGDKAVSRYGWHTAQLAGKCPDFLCISPDNQSISFYKQTYCTRKETKNSLFIGHRVGFKGNSIFPYPASPSNSQVRILIT